MRRQDTAPPDDLRERLAQSSSSASRLVWTLLGGALLRFRGRTLIAFLLVIIAKVTAVAVPLALKAIVDELGKPPILSLPVFLLLGYALLRFLGTLFGELRDLIFAKVANSTVSGFLIEAFEHLHRLSVRFHVIRRTGALTRDVERGTGGIGFLLGVALFTVFPTIVEILAVIGIMMAGYSLWFTVIILATFVAYATFTVIWTERRAIHQRALNELDSSANARMVDSLLNFETVRFYTNERFERERFDGILRKWIDAGGENQKGLFALHVGQSAIIAVGVASVMLLAGESVLRGAMTVGDLVLVNAYVIQVCLPLNSLGFVFRQARDAMVNAERFFRLMREQPDITDAPTATALDAMRGEVRFEHVDFGYDPSRQVLWDVSFSIPPGRKVAIVGGSGSGKSTLARLLFRFYDPLAGRIRIDGQDIRDVTQQSLRQAIGIVPQDTILFNDTIAYNIAYGRPDASVAEVIEAAKAAHIHEFIASLPDQYDTLVGERGVKLSGGEKQRIAIARAILKNPLILIFDEATSALDPRSERAIQDELDRLSLARTTLLIAHRLSTVVDADEILVLEHGRVVERGSHEQLLRKDGVYAQMWRLQRQQQELQRTENGLAMQPLNLVAMMAGVVETLKPTIDARRISFYSTISTESAAIVGDPSRLQQALWKLTEHAIASSPAGGRIEMKIERAGPRVRLRLNHSADGQAQKLAVVPERSNALDLASVRSLLEQQGATLEFNPASGPGTSVMIEYPLRAVSEAFVPPVRRMSGGGAALPRPSIEGIWVLIVDDKPEAREQIEAALHKRGALSRSYGSGAEALEWLRSLPRQDWPDLMICDVALGEEDGFEIIRQLRNLEAQREFELSERLPAVALSSYSRSEDRMRALLAGFQVHLSKPVDPNELATVVASFASASAGSHKTAVTRRQG